ncbi:MAG: carbamoyltransferase C-terminal domain-containing protein [Gemmatimonadota bacterium]
MSSRAPRWALGVASALGRSGPAWRVATAGRRARFRRNRRRLPAALQRTFGIRAPVERVDHHEAHAWGAYLTSGLREATVITLDGGGDGHAAKVFVGRAGRLRTLHATTTFHSIGNYYAYVTKLLGFQAHKHEGKVTGLAAYGEPRHLPVLRRLIGFDPRAGGMRNHGGRLLWAAFEQLRGSLPSDARPEDVAASIQLLLEEEVTAFVRHWVRRTGIPHLALAGGVFANVKLNQRILELPEVETVRVHPPMGDEGLCLGAACGVHARRAKRPPALFQGLRLRTLYLGSRHAERSMERALRDEGLPHLRLSAVAPVVAELLAGGAIVARFDGAMEFGPRALGNRSILYRATDPDVNRWLNERLQRTEFMPFAPATLAESAERSYLGLAGAEESARHMTITFDCTEWMRREMPAVVHVDGTARPQLVDAATSPEYHAILQAYERRTGLNSIVNTSFNMHEEPIVASPEDAVRAFRAAELDYLSMGPFLAARSADALTALPAAGD